MIFSIFMWVVIFSIYQYAIDLHGLLHITLIFPSNRHFNNHSKKDCDMKKWMLICTLCFFALFYPCVELPCYDTSGTHAGIWSGISCNGLAYSGTWTGYVTDDCQFIGTGEWESVIGLINPSTQQLTANGSISEECGSIKMNGTFTSSLMSVSGDYSYSEGGSGLFSGHAQH